MPYVIRTAAAQELADKYGTPRDFAVAVRRAYGDGFVDAQECNAAIRKYEDEWFEAMRCPCCGYIYGCYCHEFPHKDNPLCPGVHK
jgi:hypothetical protein